MVLHRDFLMRAIQRLADVFFRIATKNEVETPEEARDEIEQALGEMLGVEKRFVMGQGPAAMESLDTALAAETCRLLFLHAKLCEEDGLDPTNSATLAAAALERAFGRPYTERTSLAAEQLEEHRDPLLHVVGDEAVASLAMGAFRWCEWKKAWAEAEDWLFLAVELEPVHRVEGVAFYRRLLEMDDDDLEAGDLPRAEVEDSLTELLDR